ncbi:MAG: enoyl-CoA hydratase-related protein [Bacteroidota bacterium]|nr:enoyl-CoA hydratase-related protein [Bacteroidota bacterium]
MTYQHISLSTDKHIVRVKLNRPPVNAFNRELVAELSECASQIKNDPDAWIIVVTAEGKAFCAGADLKERAGISQNEVLNVVKGIQSVIRAWCEISQPIIMGIHAPALGGGLEFALAGDILVASESATLGLPETSLGIIPAAGGTQRLAQRTSSGVAKKWILTAKHFTALEAKEDGVVDYVFPDKTFSIQLEKIVQQISANAPLALRQAKKAIEGSYDTWLGDGFERELLMYQPLIPTHDRAEALTAFKEKRKPQWKGK